MQANLRVQKIGPFINGGSGATVPLPSYHPSLKDASVIHRDVRLRPRCLYFFGPIRSATIKTIPMAQGIPADKDPNISKDSREFLKELNNSGAPPLETLEPIEARGVLIDAQKSVSYDYGDIEESEKILNLDGQNETVHI